MIGILLSGCQTGGSPGVVTKLKFVVAEPPASFYKCPPIPIPNPARLTNKQVNDYIAAAYTANKTCRINMNSIKKFIARAKSDAK